MLAQYMQIYLPPVMANSSDPNVSDNGPPCSEDDAKKLLILGVFGAFESGVRTVFFLRGIENVSFNKAFLLMAGNVAVVAREELRKSFLEGGNSGLYIKQLVPGCFHCTIITTQVSFHSR